MLGVITLKDHSLAPVSQGTKAMDTIVQVKFFGFFQVHLKQFSTIRLSLRGDCWHVLKSMRKRECVLPVTDYIWGILHGGAKILILFWILFLPRENKIHIFKPPLCSSFYYIDEKTSIKIIEGNYRNYVIDKTHVRDHGKYTIGVPDVVFMNFMGGIFSSKTLVSI